MRFSISSIAAVLVIGVAGTVAPVQASAAPVTRDFDNFSSPPVTCCYATSPINVAIYADLTVSGGASGRVMNSSGWANLQTSGDNLFGSMDGFIDFFFTAPVSGLNFDLINGIRENSSLTVSYFDTANALLETDVVNLTAYLTPGSVMNVTGNAANIARARITSANNFAVDTINFDAEATSVPEPASIALLGITALGLGLSRRRRKQ